MLKYKNDGNEGRGGVRVNDRFLKACRGEPTDTVPVWFMRQAGRYQAEYRMLRQRYELLDLIHDPDLCCQVTTLPVEQLGVDAAILFSDIMVPLGPMGVSYRIQEGVGPVLERPFRTADDIAQLRPLNGTQGLDFVPVAIQKICQQLSAPLIGFSGAPFTLASYLIEGGPSRLYVATKRMLWAEPKLWARLMDRLSEMVAAYATIQVQAGVHAIQLFDSWAGALSRQDFDRAVKPYLVSLVQELMRLHVPLLYFSVGAGHLMESLADIPLDVIGVDWRHPLGEMRRRAGGRTLQGNLDPVVLLAPWETIEDSAAEVLRQGQGGGHIFNLGHGVLPATDPVNLRRLVDFVHHQGA